MSDESPADRNAEDARTHRRADIAERELRETAEELERVRVRLEEATGLLRRFMSGEHGMGPDVDAFLSGAPAREAKPKLEQCKRCGCWSEIEHGAEHMGAVEFPESVCEMCCRYESAESTLAATQGRVESLANWLNEPGRYVTAKRAAELVSALLTPAPTPLERTAALAAGMEGVVEEAMAEMGAEPECRYSGSFCGDTSCPTHGTPAPATGEEGT